MGVNSFDFDSRPDSRNRITRVAVDGDKAAITLISLIENSQTLTSVQPLAISLFKINGSTDGGRHNSHHHD